MYVKKYNPNYGLDDIQKWWTYQSEKGHNSIPHKTFKAFEQKITAYHLQAPCYGAKRLKYFFWNIGKKWALVGIFLDFEAWYLGDLTIRIDNGVEFLSTTRSHENNNFIQTVEPLQNLFKQNIDIPLRHCNANAHV